jgi:hypothetical protein
MEMKNLALVFLVLLVAAGCSREPRTDLMRKMELSGAGDLRSVTSQSIEQWFLRNPDVAFDISRTCRKLKVNTPASWGDTPDGRICMAAAQVHIFYYRLRAADNMTFSLSR